MRDTDGSRSTATRRSLRLALRALTILLRRLLERRKGERSVPLWAARLYRGALDNA
jgi:hypothetical protein